MKSRLIFVVLWPAILIWTGFFLADNFNAFAHSDSSAEPAAIPTLTVAWRGRNAAADAEDSAKRKANENAITILGAGRQTSFTQFAEEISNLIASINGNELRILPVLGHSETQNVLDLLYLKNIDMAVVDRDVLLNLKKQDPGRFSNLEDRISYVTKLFNTAIHIYAHTDVTSLENLRGKKVSCLRAGSTIDFMCRTIFNALKIDVEVVNDDFETALSKVKTREIAAGASGGAQPIPGFESIRPMDDLHFVPVNSDALPNSDFKSVLTTYLPIELGHDDYPNMIPEGKTVSSVATTSLLVVYAWPPGSIRYKRVEKFIDLFFNHINALRHEPYHPKWKDVNLKTEVRGWTRFAAAETWLKSTPTPITPELSPDEKMRIAFTVFVEEQERINGTPLTAAQKGELWILFRKYWETVKKHQQQSRM
jgi:TRAP-type uncharacterized transport system substrate-binding protein